MCTSSDSVAVSSKCSDKINHEITPNPIAITGMTRQVREGYVMWYKSKFFPAVFDTK